MKKLHLTQAKECLVDDEDYEALAPHKWCLSNGYAVRRAPGSKSGHLYVHQLVMGSKRGDIVHHIDGNKLNCQRGNMIVYTRGQYQQRNAPRTLSGFKGVVLQRGKYNAHIGSKGKTLHLGVFLTKDDAARAYDVAAMRLYGDYATLNFSDGDSVRAYAEAIRLEDERMATAEKAAAMEVQAS